MFLISLNLIMVTNVCGHDKLNFSFISFLDNHIVISKIFNSLSKVAVLIPNKSDIIQKILKASIKVTEFIRFSLTFLFMFLQFLNSIFEAHLFKTFGYLKSIYLLNSYKNSLNYSNFSYIKVVFVP